MDIKKRTSDIMNIYKKLNELNLGLLGYEEFDDFRTICNKYIRDGQPVKGNIKVLGTKRIICYDFNNLNVSCYLKYDENV